MWITEIALCNVRSFPAATLSLSRRINLLVGPNNSGKSTILLALSSLQDGLPSLVPPDCRLGETSAKVTFGIADPDPTCFRSKVSAIADYSLELAEGEGHFSLRGRKDQEREVKNLQRFPNKEPANFIYPFTAKRKVTSLSDRITEDTVTAVTPTFDNLNAKIDRLANPGFQPAHDFYRRACQDVLGFLVFTGHTPEGKRAIYTVRNMQSIPLLSMGEGVMNILGLIVHLAIAENKLFLIEEPGNDVHPRALKALLRYIEERSATNQFIITTHSSIVLKSLGSTEESRVCEVSQQYIDGLPTSALQPIGNKSADRRRVLESLGYELNDLEFWEGWLFLEESSAEKIIREYLLPWFYPKLSHRLRTYSAHSASEITPRFRDFNQLFVFLHLQAVYKNRVWIVVDGGSEEERVINQLKVTYDPSGWRTEQFLQLAKHDFELYYPALFALKVKETLAIPDKQERRHAKKELLAFVES